MTEISQELVEPFVLAAHGNEGKVRELYEAHPEVLSEPWAKFDETALQAASHMGNARIAEYLLSVGAPLTVCAACMLGRADDVRRFLEADRGTATSVGAHGIPVLYHAALSGKPEIAQMLVEYGGGEGIDGALHAAVLSRRPEMVNWLLDHGVSNVNVGNFSGKTPLAVAEELELNEISAILREHGSTV